MKNKSSLECAKASMKIIQEIYPAQIKLIQLDNGREFMGEFKKQLDNYNIRHTKSRPYNLKYQGSAESFNKAIQNRIHTYKVSYLVRGKNFNLEKAINDILNYYNNQ